MLSDRTIKAMMAAGDIKVIGEIDPWQVQPVSLDLRLGQVMDENGNSWLTGEPGDTEYMVQPYEFLLGSTQEAIGLSRNIVGMVHGKSTPARQGLIVHAAGLVDPGFHGELTLEIFNMSPKPVQLKPGMLICQVTFDILSTTPDRAYGHPELFSSYQGQKGPTPARIRS